MSEKFDTYREIKSPETETQQTQIATHPRFFEEGIVLSEGNKDAEGKKRLSVLLLVPPYSFDPRFETRRASAPLGLETVANELVQRGLNVVFIDAARAKYDQLTPKNSDEMRYGLTDEQIREVLKQFPEIDIVGVTSMFSNQSQNVADTTKIIRELYPEALIVEGGAHATGAYEEVLSKDENVDAVVRRQGMITFAELCETLETSKKDPTKKDLPSILKKINGVAYKDTNKEVVCNPDRPFVKNLDELAPRLIDIELHPMYDTAEHTGGSRGTQEGRYAYIMTGYGCPGRCGFCTAKMMSGREVAQFSLDRIEQEVKQLKEAGVNELIIEDDQFLVNIPRALAVMEIFKKYQMKWFEEGGISMFKLMKPGKGYDYKTIIDKMAESGCYRFYLAIESANAESLKQSSKPDINTHQDEAEEIVKYIQSKGIQAVGGFMLGFKSPGYEESLQDMEKTVAYAKKLKEAGLPFVMLFLYTGLPGSRVYDYIRPMIEEAGTGHTSHEKAGFPVGGLSTQELTRKRLEWMIEVNGKESMKKAEETLNWGV